MVTLEQTLSTKRNILPKEISKCEITTFERLTTSITPYQLFLFMAFISALQTTQRNQANQHRKNQHYESFYNISIYPGAIKF